MSLLYVAIYKDGECPIAVTDSIEKLEILLQEYMGMGPNWQGEHQAEYIGFTQYDDRGYIDPYEGYYTFKDKDGISTFKRYCMGLNELV